VIWLLAIAIFLLGTAALALIPRIIMDGNAAAGRINLAFRHLFFRLYYNSTDDTLTGWILGFRVHCAEISKKKKEKEPPVKKKPKVKTRADIRRSSFSRIMREKTLVIDLLKRATRFIIRIVRSARVERLNLNIIIAAEDRMLTGTLFGALQPLVALNKPPLRQIIIDADWSSDRPRLEAEWRLSTRLICSAWIVLTTLLQLPYIRMYRAARKK